MNCWDQSSIPEEHFRTEKQIVYKSWNSKFFINKQFFKKKYENDVFSFSELNKDYCPKSIL